MALGTGTAIALGGLGTMLLFTVVGGLIGLTVLLNHLKNNLDIIIRQSTGGKPIVRRERGKMINHKKYGYFIYIPRTKEVIPPIPDEYQLPTTKGRRKFLDITIRDEIFTANQIKHLQKFKPEEVQKYFKNEDGEKIGNNLYKDVEFLISPISYNARQFVWTQKELVNEKTNPDKNFWATIAPYLGIAAIVSGAVVVSVVIIIFSYQAAKNGTFNSGALQSASFNMSQVISNLPKG